jgi:ABC-2 type transport system ATP-binding protein
MTDERPTVTPVAHDEPESTAVADDEARPTEATAPGTETAESGPEAAASEPEAAEPESAARAEPEPAAPAQPESQALITMRGVTRRFDDRLVVREIDLAVPRGTILGIIGPSGSGKTTTIRMLTGALAPTAGEIEVLGERPVAFRRSTRERIGYMPQLFTLYPDLTARENVDFVGSMFGMLWPRRRSRTKAVLKLLDLWDARGKRASALSGGMQRRLELACALVHEPTLLILDEPTAGLDPLLRGTVWDELHRLRDAGRTILVTTQYVGEAEECDAVALIAEGRLLAVAPPAELRRQAMGGEIIEIETAGLFDGSVLETEPGVMNVRQLDAKRLHVTVENAATGMPAVVDAVGRNGAEVASARELKLNFDDVFAALVARAEASAQAGDGRPGAAA